MRPWLLLLVSIGSLAPMIVLVRIIMIAVIKPAEPMMLIPVLIMGAFFIPWSLWVPVLLWRGAVTLHPDRIVYGPWLRQKSIRRDELAGFRLSDFKNILVLLPRQTSREAFIITLPSIKRDAAFWHWLETLGDRLRT